MRQFIFLLVFMAYSGVCHAAGVVSVHTVNCPTWTCLKHTVRAGQYPAGKTLVVLDIDNTLLDTTTFIGSPQWFDWQARLYHQQSPQAIGYRPGKQLVFSDFLKINDFVLNTVSTKLSEPMIPSVIALWQRRGASVISVTSRSVETRFSTLAALVLYHLDLSLLAPGEVSIEQGHGCYLHGVLFTSGGNKATYLLDLLKREHKKNWVNLIVVDDTPKNLQTFSHSKALSQVLPHLHTVSLYHYSRKAPFSSVSNWCRVGATDRSLYRLYQAYSSSALTRSSV